MDSSTELPVALPGLRAVRGTTMTLHTGVKEFHGIGRIEQGSSEYWGNGKVSRSTPRCILVKEPGDVVRHLGFASPITFVAIQLPANDVARARDDGRAGPIAQLDGDDERAAPFHRLVDAVLAGSDRLSLEVALAEALGGLARIRTPDRGRTRPVHRAMEYLRARLAETFTLDDLADHADLDKFHLCRAFRAQVGMPPHTYLTHLRIARAKALLRDGMRASDVAPLVGIYDQAQLTRHFRRLVGTTPGRYAKAMA